LAPQLRWLVFAIVFALLSIFSKQDSVILIFALLGSLCIYERSFKTILIFLAFIFFLAAALGTAYLICGRFFFINTLIYNLQVITGVNKYLYIKLYALSLLRLLPLVLGACYILYCEIKEYRKERPKIFITVMALFYLGITHLMMLRAGSYINYTYSAVLLLILSLAMFPVHHKLWSGNRKLLYAGCAIYMVFLVWANHLIHSYTFDPASENLNRQNYYSALRDKSAITRVTKNDTLFCLNAKYLVLFADKPLVYGYDMHIDRMIEVLTGFKFQSRIPFVSTVAYDSLFETGAVRYIVAENNGVSKEQIKNYYRHFHFLLLTREFCLYKYDGKLNDEGIEGIIRH
jgi:hypothetical protein